MPLAPGTRLGPYEVDAPIGAGGMGEVYRARDTNLGREVAIKVLPQAFATDRDRLARFEREARILASLNHPNIAQIYGVERSEGANALVMELVAGDDLSKRVAAGPLPVAEALAIARQIAQALEAAHEAGLVHRDLKPANIKVREDGTVKVLDFGLAKALDTTGAGQDFGPAALANSPTLTSPATGLGMILGTAAYMSPEQAKGKPADKRSDIWAFGCVLYEMLTGHRPFAGDDVSDTLASVLAREPDLTALPVTISPALRMLVERCLVKDRRERLGDIAAVHLLLNEPAAFTAAKGTAPAVAPPRATKERVTWSAALALIGAVALAGWIWRPAADVPPEYRLQIATPPFFNPTAFAISPDGLKVAFWATVSGKTQMWLQFLDAETAKPLDGTEGVGTTGSSAPFWSPDSRSLGFIATGKLRRVDVAGGSRPLADVRSSAYGGAWGGDDTIVYTAANSSPLFRVSADRGEPVPATTLAPGQAAHRFPSFLPDGRHFLFLATGPAAVQGVYIGSIDSTESHRLFQSESAAVFLTPDLVLYGRDNTLVAQRIDLDTLRPVGNPFPVAPSVARFSGVFGTVGISSARTGTFTYRPATAVARQLEWRDRTGALQTVVRPADMALEVAGSSPTNRLSPDAAWTTAIRRIDGNNDVWIIDTARGTLRQLTTNPANDDAAVWSPRSDRLVFGSQRRRGGGQNDLFIRDLGATGVETLLLETGENKNLLDWSSDGRTILFRVQNTTTGDDIWALPMEGGRPGKPFPVLVTAKNESLARFSPDNRWMTYASTASGFTEVLVQRFPDGNTQQVSQGGGSFPAWSRDGSEVVYLSPDNQLVAVPVTLGPGDRVTPGTPVKLFRESLRPTTAFDVTRDGQRFLINTPVEDAPTPPITIVLNWKGPSDSGQRAR